MPKTQSRCGDEVRIYVKVLSKKQAQEKRGKIFSHNSES